MEVGSTLTTIENIIPYIIAAGVIVFLASRLIQGMDFRKNKPPSKS